MASAGPSTIDMRELLREVQQGSGQEIPQQGAMPEVIEEPQFSRETIAEEPESPPQQTLSNDTAELLDEGELLARQGAVEDALAAFNRAIALDPTCDMAWFNRGVLLEGNGDTVGARQSFAITLDINKNNGPAAANLAILLDRIGEVEEAAVWADNALQTYPGHAVLLDVLSRAKVTPTPRLTQPPVEEVAAPTSQEEPKPITPSAVPEGTSVVAPESESIISGVDLDAVVEQATNMLRSGDSSGAMELASSHLEGEGSTNVGIWRVIAGCKGKSGDVDGAIEAYNKALGIDNADAKCWHNLGVLHRRSGRSEHALTCFSTALKLDDGYVKAADSLRQLALEIGKVDIAITAWEKLLVLEPTHSSRIEFAHLLVDIGNGEATILGAIQNLPLTLPEGPELAVIALRNITDADDEAELKAMATSLAGDHTGAVALWKEMLQRESENQGYWFGLASALEAAGDLETADKCRTKARGFGVADAQIDAANSSLAKAAMVEQSTLSSEVPSPPSDAPPPAPQVPTPASDTPAPAKSEDVPWRWSDNVVDQVIAEYHLDDRDELIEVAKNHDDGNRYLKREELQSAAEQLQAAKKTWRYSDNVVAEIMDGYGLDDSTALIEAAKLHDDGNRYLNRQEFMAAARDLMMAKQMPSTGNVAVPTIEPPVVDEPPVAAPAVIPVVAVESGIVAPVPTPAEETEGVIPDEPELLLTPITPSPSPRSQDTEIVPNINLSDVALDATSIMESSIVDVGYGSASVDADIEWYNRGLSLISEKKYREALSCLDKALKVFKDDDDMIIRILNARGNTFYYLEDYPKTIENYHQAMIINPALVSGRTLYNMGTAYAEMERYDDAIKCYGQAIPRGLSTEESALAKEQTRRCTQLRKESLRRAI